MIEALKPGDKDARRAADLMTFGDELRKKRRYEEALALYDQALGLSPGDAKALRNRGHALRNLGRFDEALASYDQALVVAPDDPRVLVNRGIVLRELGRFDEALTAYDRALELNPNDAYALVYRAGPLRDQGRFEEAILSCDRALAVKTGFSEAHHFRATLRLTLDQFAGGWDDYEYRFFTPDFPLYSRVNVDPADLALWVKPEDIRGKRVLVIAEQGIGDEIMFSETIPDLARATKDLTLECEPRLTKLFRRSFPGVRIIQSARRPTWKAADFDHVIPIGSLGRLYRNDISAFPVRKSYLAPEPDIVSNWRSRLASLGDGLKVGISWRGGTVWTGRHRRSVGLDAWKPILDVEGVQFVNLQYGNAATEVETANRGLRRPVICFDPSEMDDFGDLSGLVSALDLIVTVQTTLLHLSGAVGKTCWVMLPHNARWRYGAGRSTMPWYESVKFYRQTNLDDWGHTIACVAGDLKRLVGDRG